MRSRRTVAFAALSSLLCLVVALGCAGSSPSSAVRAFYEAIANGKTDDAIGLLSEQSVAMVGQQKLRAGIQEATRKMLAKNGLKEVKILDEKAAGDVATVSTSIRYGDGSEEKEVLQLVKEKGSWRLQPKK